jgi:hypothetical protein
MSRRLLPLALALGVVAAACAKAPVAPEFGSGQGFVPEVVDSLNDAGRHASVVVVDGRPVVAYFSFAEQVPEAFGHIKGHLVFRQPGRPDRPRIALTGDAFAMTGIEIDQQIHRMAPFTALPRMRASFVPQVGHTPFTVSVPFFSVS